MSASTFIIHQDWTSTSDIQQYLQQKSSIVLDEQSIQLIERCRNYLDQKVAASGQPYYGINTGFGYLQNVQIDAAQLEQLQNNLLMSHACGLGAEVPSEIVRLMILLKVKSLSYGYSGVQLDTVQRLIQFHNQDILPVVFQQGSLGASGDLAPLSHLSLPLIGLGTVYDGQEKKSTEEVLKAKGWSPIALKSKEGLALINGTQFMTAYGMYCLVKAQQLLKWADVIAALSLDAFDGIAQAFHEKVHSIRPHQGQVETAENLRRLLAGSELTNQSKTQVQDPYSFRCIPQVHGATKDAVRHVQSVFEKEINAVTDNPNVFVDDDLIISGGNFHGQPLALALDYFAIAMSEIANISERRTYQLISGQRSLPLFLVKQAGLNSGFMIPQYTAASIVSENKQLSTPSSVDSISSSNNQEDHVSMGANAATKAYRVIHNVEKVLAIELFTAVQAIEFRRPLKTSAYLENLIQAYRKKIPFVETDRVLHTDMEKSIQFIQNYSLQ